MHFTEPRIRQFIMLSICLLYVAWADGKNVSTVKKLDFNRFFGTWYEIARLPNKHEKGLVEVTTTINKTKDGKIVIVNDGFKGSRRGRRTTVKGEISFPNPEVTSRFKMKVWLFCLDYKVIHVDSRDYQYALITSNSDKYLWILSRTPVMDDEQYNDIVANAKSMGFNVSKLEKVSQDYNCALAERLGSSNRRNM